MTTTRKTTIRSLLAATALVAVALAFAPGGRAVAGSGPNGTGGLNGTSRDGIDPAAGCIMQSAAATSPAILLANGGPQGTGGLNGTSRDGIDPAAGCIARSESGAGLVR